MALVSAAVGPGSFTGIRIGVTAAKTLAYALHCPVVPCDTLAAIVRQVRQGVSEHGAPASETVDAAINAYRGQVYCRRETGGGQVVVASQAMDRQEWFASLRSMASEPITVAGDAWKSIDPLPPHVKLAPRTLWHPMAETIGQLGWESFERGEAIEAMRLAPVYLRASAAEENLKSPSR